MLLLPIATDAPLAHPPLATVAMVVATVLVYGAVGGGPTALNAGLWLDYGQGLHPFHWLSSNFVHLDLKHLLGNMAFLWVFGLIVEGKVARQRAGDAQRLADARQEFQRLLDAGDFVAAHALRPSLVDADGGVLLAEAHLRRLAFGLRDARAWPEAADVMEEYVRLYPFGAEGMRIGLAHIQAGWLDQPHEALAVLDGLDEDHLTPDDVALAERIRRKARAMIVARSKSG